MKVILLEMLKIKEETRSKRCASWFCKKLPYTQGLVIVASEENMKKLENKNKKTKKNQLEN
jgi:ribosomal protein L9